jgi:hypothetical protein
MRHRKIISLFIITTILVSACAAPLSESRENYVKAHPNLDPQTKDAILKGEATVGMTQEEVKTSCGAPNIVTKGVEAGRYCDYWGYKRFTVTLGPDGQVINVK